MENLIVAKSRHVLVVTTAISAVVASGCYLCPEVPTPERNCGADDPRVGLTAEFINTFIHNVHGTARIVDNCTIVIEGFIYDGLGLDVRVVGVVHNDFGHPTVLTPNIVRAGGYQGETLTVKLPEGVTLDDCETISIMCVPITTSFAHAAFRWN